MQVQNFLQNRRECFCAFCKTPRKVYKSKHLSILAIMGLVGLSFLLSHVIWETADPRGLFILAILMMSGELFSQVKWRQSMNCSSCGFDLILYKKNPEKAAQRINTFLEMRAGNPDFLLKPALQLPKKTKIKTEIKSSVDSFKHEQQPKGTKLSLQG